MSYVEIHRVSMDSPCLSSENESEQSFNFDDVACIHDDDDKEPLATEEEAARYNADMEREAEIEEEYRRRYNGEVNNDTWCSCLCCSVLLITKAEECQCCHEIDRCGEIMAEIDQEGQCITLHPGFRDVCLNKYVLEVASLGLKTKSGQSYKTLLAQGKRSEAEFLRSVAYRQFTRLVWGYLGSSKRYPLPCCAYHVIRKEFPNEDGQYHGYEEES
ncbi:P2X purinoceptor 7-like [Acropora muricata]|uniref:P2X purinoceptor 7-like n=1 Tax=Acropora muricata TaxID=159855 RepID=UPI0034E402C5